MTRKEIENFLSRHPDKEVSAAKFEYSLYVTPEVIEISNEILDNALQKSEEDLRYEIVIQETDDPEGLLKLMRKAISWRNKGRLCKKILQHEEEICPLIQKKALTNKQDIFIENTLRFFLYSTKNYSNWILENYHNIDSEYLKSLLCLVIGFKGEKDSIPLLMKETERFEKSYPTESYEQGPLLAIQELMVRFYKK